ncbi:MAG: membrane protein insertase YidC [Lactobacillus sp.]|uniref:membrane protein insertase YidC n=1 Tax=Lacticaseibacillus suilingensis TaxID=2799577 RepID=UPI0022E4C588|nr:membrane protein insertase YidC [Lacticaseibacillus suilingensis]MCI1894837.1 membrane protein insertase YidC [Lactobacillus sp.]MCI1918222.1 membrane protein insertase YidC [Lactobacillus sp.]MCI1940654.1 membrane protein insertase YidC [Lactobacillus sp.]MCI1971340.1 membrane protein insertase YidC [Lactobacillus sp.]MCI2037285.1 membrane protein insertase YidC [Lactobacillus sp.]
MSKFKRGLTLGGIGVMTVLLSACKRAATTQLKPPTGFFGMFYDFIGKPLQNLMGWIANDLLKGSASGYGIAIVLITLVVRLVLLPLMLNQQKNMTASQEKQRVLKPQLDLIQKQMKKPGITQEEQVKLNGLMQDVYRKNGTSMIPSMGCLTMLIQLPIFSGLYQAVAYSPEISSSKFFGIALGQSSMVITIIATLLYVAQSFIMLQMYPPEQRKQMQTMSMMSPLMTFFFCMMYNAGLGLYFLAGGVIVLVQQVIVTYVITPGIRKRMDAELAENPPVIVVDEHTFDVQPASAPVEAAYDADAAAADDAKPRSHHGRNAGKQHRR